MKKLSKAILKGIMANKEFDIEFSPCAGTIAVMSNKFAGSFVDMMDSMVEVITSGRTIGNETWKLSCFGGGKELSNSLLTQGEKLPEEVDLVRISVSYGEIKNA